MCQNELACSQDASFSRLLIGIVLFSFLIPSAYADTSGFEEPIAGVFDWINNIVSANIDSSNLPDNTETNLQSSLDTGTEAGKAGVSLWFKVHAFFVELIFAGVDEASIPIDKDIIVIISMVLVAIMGIFLLKKLLHENFKVGIVVVIIVVAFALAGFTIEF